MRRDKVEGAEGAERGCMAVIPAVDNININININSQQ